jgi:hypothetical protein
MPVILAIQKAENRMMAVWSQPGQIVEETLSLHEKRADGVAQGVGTEFKSQYCKKRKKKD